MYLKLTNMNLADPNDSYLLLHIDALVNSYLVMSFLNSFFSYYQIKMYSVNHQETTFSIGDDFYSYKLMSCKLKLIIEQLIIGC